MDRRPRSAFADPQLIMPSEAAPELSKVQTASPDRDELSNRLWQQSLPGEFDRIAIQTCD
jgi:hypothetical protein